MRWKRLVCRFRGCRVDGPEQMDRVLCSRCGAVYNAELLRAVDAEYQRRGEKPMFPELRR